MDTYISLNNEWTGEQKEVWKVIEDHWQCLVSGKVDEFLKFIHPQFVGFGHESPYPVDFGWLKDWVGFWSKSTTFLIHALRPQHIIIHGDIAVVQYYLFTITKNDVSAGASSIRRYTMTWKKEKGKWRVIASHNNLQGSH